MNLLGYFDLQLAENFHVLSDAVVGELFDVLEAHDAAVRAGDSGEAGRGLVDIQ